MRRLDEHVAGCRDCAAFLAVCRELSCRDFVEFLNDYLGGTLAAARREVFERHLAICADCRNYLRSYRRVMELSALAFAGELEGTPAVPEELVHAILAARAQAAAD